MAYTTVMPIAASDIPENAKILTFFSRACKSSRGGEGGHEPSIEPPGSNLTLSQDVVGTKTPKDDGVPSNLVGHAIGH